jgi:hypothetical protein
MRTAVASDDFEQIVAAAAGGTVKKKRRTTRLQIGRWLSHEIRALYREVRSGTLDENGFLVNVRSLVMAAVATTREEEEEEEAEEGEEEAA